MSRWFTFAPCNFRGIESFFWRDSGLLNKGLQQLGYESQVILRGPAYAEDLPGIIRAELHELESPEWWRALKLDGVIMVAWGRHRDTPIVRAIAASGTPLVLHIDSGGHHFPLFNQIETLKAIWRVERGTNRGWWIRSFFFLKEALVRAVTLLLRHSYQKYKHLQYGTVVSLQTPSSLEGHRRLCTLFGGKDHGVNLQLVGPHIPDVFRWDSSVPKEKRIISIGRWDDLRQKRPYFLMDVCAAIGRRHSDLHIDLLGMKTEALENWHRALEPELRERVHLHGVQPAESVARVAQKAQISLLPSASESIPLVLFEMLSCGASAVALDSCYQPGARWAAQCNHADLVSCDTVDAFVAALERGLEKWECGEYSARQISEYWIPRTRVQSILEKMLSAVDAAQSPSGNSPAAIAR